MSILLCPCGAPPWCLDSRCQCGACLQIKMHWVGDRYWRPGPEGNDIQKTNVPNLRMRFRHDCLQVPLHC